MSFTSSEIQKKLERGAFSIHIALKQIEALKAEIAGYEDQMYETARSLYENEQLVEASIAMAQMSIPALEMRASKIVAGNNAAVSFSKLGESENVSYQDVDLLVGEDGVSSGLNSVGTDDETNVVDLPSEGVDYAKIHVDEFFGVEVPVSQFDLAREIKREAAVSAKQNTKNNTYASDRGKNAWRKALFTRARADYLANGSVYDEKNLDEAVVRDELEPVTTELPVSIIDSIDDYAETSDTVDKVVDASSVYLDVVEETNELVAEAVDREAQIDFTASEPVNVEDVIETAFETEVEPESNLTIYSPEDVVDPVVVEAREFDDIPFFGEEPAASSSEQVDASPAISTVNDDKTLSIDDTFFPDDDIPVMEALTFEDETPHQDDSMSFDELQDIDVPDFDPDAELFDDKISSPTVEVMSNSLSVSETVETISNDRPSITVSAEEKASMTAPVLSPRVVSISSLPAHQRPGAPRPQAAPNSAPSRPQPGSSSSRVVTVPPPRPDQPAATTIAPTRPASSPVAPSRSAPARTPSSRTPETSSRTHGYGAKVPAPDGLEEAIRERDAAAKAATQSVQTPPARPGSAPARPSPGVPRPNLPFTKPSFGR